MVWTILKLSLLRSFLLFPLLPSGAPSRIFSRVKGDNDVEKAKTYTFSITGLTRELPLCKVTDDTYIAAFICFGDVFF
jgi:hypothetical protein